MHSIVPSKASVYLWENFLHCGKSRLCIAAASVNLSCRHLARPGCAACAACTRRACAQIRDAPPLEASSSSQSQSASQSHSSGLHQLPACRPVCQPNASALPYSSSRLPPPPPPYRLEKGGRVLRSSPTAALLLPRNGGGDRCRRRPCGRRRRIVTRCGCPQATSCRFDDSFVSFSSFSFHFDASRVLLVSA